MDVVLALPLPWPAVLPWRSGVAGLPSLRRYRYRPADRIRRMSRHPSWCAGGHRCGLGEHRSDPQTWLTSYGTIVATRIRRADGRDRLELRAVVDLPGEDVLAQDVARLLAVGVDLTVRDVLHARLARLRRAYHRLTGVRVR